MATKFRLSSLIPAGLIGERSDVVEGSALREGDQLRVAAQLIDLGTGAHLWSRSFDRKITDVSTIQSELTTEIIAQLAPSIGRSVASSSPCGHTLPITTRFGETATDDVGIDG